MSTSRRSVGTTTRTVPMAFVRPRPLLTSKPRTRASRIALGCVFLISFMVFIVKVLSVPHGGLRQADAPHNVLAASIEANSRVSLAGMYDLAKRRVPVDDFDRLDFALADGSKGEEWFKWTVLDGRTLIEGTTLSSISHGLADFYERYCSINLLSWSDKSRPNRSCFSSESPTKPTSHRGDSRFGLRYGWNAVTFSYTTVYWDWARYEQELDWLALRGVNLLLSHEGQEILMREVFGKDADEFFTHQTYFAWNRMGNIHMLEGPPSEEYLLARLALQHQILQRMKELGIKPVLFGFNGFVPKAFSKKSNCEQKQWSGFPSKISSVCRVGDVETLRQLTVKLMTRQLEEFERYLDKSDLVYFSSDLYNENPISLEWDIGMLARAVHSSHEEAVKKRGFASGFKLVVQMWFFANDYLIWTPSKAQQFLQAFPSNSLVLLDLHAEKQSQALRLGLDEEWVKKTKQILIFCVLHNFGGGGGIAGEIDRTLAKVSSMKGRLGGIGFAPEGLEQNELVYDSILNFNWNDFSLERWVEARYRTEKIDRSIVEAWGLVYSTAYARPARLGGFGPTKSIWESRPMPGMLVRGRFMPTLFSYDVSTFFKATESLLKALDESKSMLNDLVDFTRQALSDFALEIVIHMQRVNLEDDETKFKADKERLLRLLDLVGRLLSSHPSFCFKDLDLKKFSAKDVRLRRQLLTVWHETNNGALSDYGSRQLGGSLFRQVHQKRWEFLLEEGKKRFGMVSSYSLANEYQKIEKEWYDSTTLEDCPAAVPAKIVELVKEAIEFGKQNLQVLLEGSAKDKATFMKKESRRSQEEREEERADDSFELEDDSVMDEEVD